MDKKCEAYSLKYVFADRSVEDVLKISDRIGDVIDSEFTEDWMMVGEEVTDESRLSSMTLRHGYWSFTEYDYFDCSVCGQSYANNCNSIKEAKYRLKSKYDLYKFCPHCGAKMDLESPEIKSNVLYYYVFTEEPEVLGSGSYTYNFKKVKTEEEARKLLKTVPYNASYRIIEDEDGTQKKEYYSYSHDDWLPSA